MLLAQIWSSDSGLPQKFYEEIIKVITDGEMWRERLCHWFQSIHDVSKLKSIVIIKWFSSKYHVSITNKLEKVGKT